MFSRDGRTARSGDIIAAQQPIESNQILLTDKDEQVLVVGLTSGSKSAIYDWLVVSVAATRRSAS